MSSDLALAGKYANALFAAAAEHHQEHAEEEGLKKVEEIFTSQPKLLDALGHPAIALTDKMRLVKPLLSNSSLLTSFIELLISRKRLFLLPEIRKAYAVLMDAKEGVEPVTVSSAYKLTEADRKRLEKSLPGWLGKKVRLQLEVEPHLIGGLRIRTREAECDQSIRGQLSQLQRYLSAQ